MSADDFRTAITRSSNFLIPFHINHLVLLVVHNYPVTLSIQFQIFPHMKNRDFRNCEDAPTLWKNTFHILVLARHIVLLCHKMFLQRFLVLLFVSSPVFVLVFDTKSTVSPFL